MNHRTPSVYGTRPDVRLVGRGFHGSGIPHRRQGMTGDLPRHEAGEIVWATFGNYLESGRGPSKMRPAVIIRVGSPQHWIAGITSQATAKGNGEPRVPLPVEISDRPSYLWSSRMARLCRLDVRYHIGWIDLPLLETLATTMQLPRETTLHLRSVALAKRPRPEWMS